MYEIGKVYIWQNLMEHTHLNGCETIVIGSPKEFHYCDKPWLGHFLYQETDTVLPDDRVLWATWDQLRPKPPTGEQSITDMFKVDHHVSEPAHV